MVHGNGSPEWQLAAVIEDKYREALKIASGSPKDRRIFAMQSALRVFLSSVDLARVLGGVKS